MCAVVIKLCCKERYFKYLISTSWLNFNRTKYPLWSNELCSNSFLFQKITQMILLNVNCVVYVRQIYKIETHEFLIKRNLMPQICYCKILTLTWSRKTMPEEKHYVILLINEYALLTPVWKLRGEWMQQLVSFLTSTWKKQVHMTRREPDRLQVSSMLHNCLV